jgi:hypothetical protein
VSYRVNFLTPELIQNAVVGIADAIENQDPTYGFSTLAANADPNGFPEITVSNGLSTVCLIFNPAFSFRLDVAYAAASDIRANPILGRITPPTFSTTALVTLRTDAPTVSPAMVTGTSPTPAL